jgi:transposase
VEPSQGHCTSSFFNGEGSIESWINIKKKTFRAFERDREDVKRKYIEFIAEVSKIPLDRLVFLDEAGVNLAMTRSHARAPEGERAVARRSGGQASNISLIGAVRLSGMSALHPYDGSIDGNKFLSFLDQHLLPNLNSGDVLVMDNLRVHHIPAVKDRLTKAGVRPLYLPPYSPELNPIEEIWSVIKRIFRGLEARTIAAFIDVMEYAKSKIAPQTIMGVFRHAGYVLCE